MTTWEHGHPDPLCALCPATPGRVRVRAPGPSQRGVRACVVFARLLGGTVALGIEASDEERPGDRLVPCPSCMEADEVKAAALEGAVLAVPPRAAERSEGR